MTVTTSQVHEFTPDELLIAGEIAGSLAIAIQHRRWVWAEQEAREREATLREVALSLTTDLESDSVMRGILDQLDKIVPTTSSAIFLVDEGRIRVVASRGVRTDAQALEQFVTNSPPIMREMIDTGQARIIADTRLDPEWATLPGGDYIRSWMGIPLTVKGNSIGVLTLDRDTADAFDEQDIARATILAAQAAIGIENARLFRHEQESAVRLEREVHERTKQLEALYEISAAASQNLDHELLLDFSLSRALQAAGYSAGVIHLLDAEQDELFPAAALGLKQEHLAALAADTPASRVLQGQLTQSGEPRMLAPSELAAMAGCVEFKTCVVSPLRAHGRALGTLLLMSTTAQPFSVETQNLLAAIADQIGLAVESSDLRRQSRQTAVLAERERIARDLHDIVTQSLYSLVNFAEAARETARMGEMDEVQRIVQSIMHTAHQALGELRVLLYDLRSDVLANKGLQKALDERLATVERRAGLATQLTVEGSNHLSPTLEDVLYRVALEALNNTFRHANAQSVAVDLIATEDEAVLRVTDDGQGFMVDDVQQGPGMGLSNIRRRVREAGGTLLLQSVPEQGTQLEFRIPTKNGATRTGRPAYARTDAEGNSQ
jgi:signal transduction histidine kinase